MLSLAQQHLLHGIEIGKGGKVNGVLAFVRRQGKARGGCDEGAFVIGAPLSQSKREVPGEEPEGEARWKIVRSNEGRSVLLAARLAALHWVAEGLKLAVIKGR